jgi:hypothetical protein
MEVSVRSQKSKKHLVIYIYWYKIIYIIAIYSYMQCSVRDFK